MAPLCLTIITGTWLGTIVYLVNKVINVFRCNDTRVIQLMCDQQPDMCSVPGTI